MFYYCSSFFYSPPHVVNTGTEGKEMRYRCPYKCLLRPVSGFMVLIAVFEVFLTFYIFTDVLPAHIRGNSERSDEQSFPQALNTTGGINQSTNTSVKYDVLVLTYMRSGSSFLGQILGWRKDTFYWYEPLYKTHRWEYLSSGNNICNSQTGVCENGTVKTKRAVRAAIDFLTDIYNCKELDERFSDFKVNFQGSQFYSGLFGKEFEHCMRHPPNCSCCLQSNTPSEICRQTTNGCRDCLIMTSQSNVCFERMVQRCHPAQHKVTKVLRIDTSLALQLLEKHPRLKLLLIFRDPRAIINSRINTKWYYESNVSHTVDANALCQRMENDLKNAIKLGTKFPGRVKMIQYEDFADQVKLAKRLYEYSGMDITEEEEDLFDTLTENEETGTTNFHPDRYRTTLSWKMVSSMNENCYYVLRKLGLRVFKSEEELKNKNLSLFVGKIPYHV